MDYSASEKQLTLRARGLAPIPNYIIVPAAGSLVGDIPSLRDDPERANAVVTRMLANSGVKHPK
jgi:hypothetical protein